MERVVPPPARRGGVTLAEQLAASSNLRDLLKLRHDDDAHLAAVAGRRRTLLDVIRGPADEDDDDRAPPAPPTAALHGRPASATRPGAAGPAEGEERRVPLMALLEQAERQWATATASGCGAWTRVEEHAAAAEEDESSSRKGSGGVGGRCCVCMSRGKGAAFVPCGHTFCRACAREVRAARGRCPLCNAAIRDVLNLF